MASEFNQALQSCKLIDHNHADASQKGVAFPKGPADKLKTQQP